eukprot:CAMPEP_0178856958 /NCGR_PEP_ID=MMETSP0746-20121128/24212_1 /TAXON_ID=913974 /ORGANISM="Nitzschia punctata, Strain CCMP561" /LENGTH=696 /DNA_ID=CAMNT_0020523183 /DNA_START=27 /DNA_END=2117 /DNA_ORIENTATION=+
MTVPRSVTPTKQHCQPHYHDQDQEAEQQQQRELSSTPTSSPPCSKGLNEDEVLNRFKVIRHDIGDKVISLSEDVLVTCDNWRDPKSNVLKLEQSISDPKKKHLVFYDMWHDDIAIEILHLLRRKSQNRCWTLIEFRGCQERHINAVLKTVLEMDIVQTIAFSLTNEKYDPMRRCTNSTLDVIAKSMQNNTRFECLIFHSRPMHFIQSETMKKLRVKRLHFLENVYLHPNEIPELAAGLKSNTSLESFSFLGGVTHVSAGYDVSKIAYALKAHPSLKRLSLCMKSSAEGGVSGLNEVVACQDSALKCLTLTGGFTISSFFPKGTFSEGLRDSSLRHLYLREVFLFPQDVEDLAAGLRVNGSLESFSMKLDSSDTAVNIAPIAFALQDNHRIQRLSLAGKCSLGEGVYGIAKLLSSENSMLKDLHMPGAFLDKSSRVPGYLQVLTDGLRGNQKLESLDLSVNGLSDAEVVMIYSQLWTCPKLDNLDLGMNEVSYRAIEAFSMQKNPNQLSVLRISSPKFSFFHINNKLCQTLLKLLSLNPRLGDVNFNMGPIEWHQTYHNGKMQWHHFFPAYRVYALHSSNKRVEYLKNKELDNEGKRDLERIQFLLDYNWAGRNLISHHIKLPVSLWPKILARVSKGRTCFWTGREQGSQLEFAHDVTYSLVREHLVNFLKSDSPVRATKRTQKDTSFQLGAKKQKL